MTNMPSKKYFIADDSPITRARVDDIKLRLGDDPVALTQDQKDRVEDTTVRLVEHTTNSSSDEN